MTDSDDPVRTSTGGNGFRRPDVRLDRPHSRRRLLAAIGTTGATLAAGCLGDGDDPEAGDQTDADDGTTPTDGADAGDGSASSSAAMDDTATGDTPEEGTDAAWQTAQLEAVRSGETFRITDLDHPVVVQTFAVWCPKCERQQDALADTGDDATVVSLNVDANEDGDRVADHAADNGFDWRFAVAPTPVTQSLIDDFGTDVTTPPTSPLVAVCGDGSTTFNAGSVLSPAGITAMTDEC